ncbi:MAG: hypothetical protein ACRAVC_09600 [Trichormus sp.]
MRLNWQWKLRVSQTLSDKIAITQLILHAIACAFSSQEIYMRSHIPSNFQPRTLGIVLIFSP